MPDDQYSRLTFKIAELERRLAATVRPATVDEVKGDKMRMIIGKGSDGQDVKGPWMDTTNHRGGARERRFFKKGQNLMLIAPNGDLSQAAIAAFAPNKKFKTPDHANKEGQDEETYQMDDLRVKKTKKGYAIWLQEAKQEQQQQGGEQGGGGNESTTEKPEEHEPQKPKPKTIINMAKDGGFTAKIGKDIRVAANKKGAKLKAGDHFVTVTKENGLSLKGKKVVIEGTDSVSIKSKKVTIQGETFSAKASGDLVLDGVVFVKGNGPPLVDPPWEIGSKAGQDAEAASDGVDDDNKVIDDEADEPDDEEGGGES
jgi:phage baseplate assembly protein gpV